VREHLHTRRVWGRARLAGIYPSRQGPRYHHVSCSLCDKSPEAIGRRCQSGGSEAPGHPCRELADDGVAQQFTSGVGVCRCSALWERRACHRRKPASGLRFGMRAHGLQREAADAWHAGSNPNTAWEPLRPKSAVRARGIKGCRGQRCANSRSRCGSSAPGLEHRCKLASEILLGRQDSGGAPEGCDARALQICVAMQFGWGPRSEPL